MTEDTQPAEAVQALRARGVDSAETLLAHDGLLPVIGSVPDGG
jgi:hypothetical protein